MYTVMNPQSMLMSAFVFLLMSIFFAFVKAQFAQQYCGNNGNYTSNSTYEANLNTLLSSLSTNIDNNGFYSASVGQNPDRANAVVWCRGDFQLHTCRVCVQNATFNLIQLCPNQRQAIFMHDSCLVRYSDGPVIGILATSPNIAIFNTRNATSPDEFMADLRTLLDNLRNQASSGNSWRKVAYGNISTSAFQTIFGMVQCTPDLSQRDCTACLMESARQLPICCYATIALGILRPSCGLYYDYFPSYNETRLQELAVTVAPTAPPISSPPGNNDNNASSSRIIIIAIVSIVGCVILVVFVAILLRKRVNRKPVEKVLDDETTADESLLYDFAKIRAATNDFSEDNKLGEGGFGSVYKGKLQNGQEIAVKRLSRDSGQGILEFKNEVMLLARLQHRNLVRLLGFSIERNEKLLVYEFLENASLDKFIFDMTKRSNLDWNQRYKIIEGIARGILYLHEDSQHRIIHRDLKASNVLLDGNMNPKIADFGMARLFVLDESQGNTRRIVGTYGYMAPEYAMQGKFSVKSDVFSFGVMILEIISGQKNTYFENGQTVKDLLGTAWKNWCTRTATKFLDPALRDILSTQRDILKCIHIGLLCVQENAGDRPTMASVMLMLKSFSITLPLPSEPAFLQFNGHDSEVRVLRDYKKSRKNEVANTASINEISITDLYAR